MAVRMTGITGLFDTDALVSASMEPYKLKVTTQKQNLQVLQWQQEQYRTTLKDSKSFYDKYLDPLGSKSLSLVSKYTTTKFTSDNDAVVTATTSNGATVDTYKVNVAQLASKASDSLDISKISDVDEVDQKIKVGSVEISFKAYSDGAKTVESYNTAISTAMKNEDKKLTDDQLKELKSNTITAKYSEFTKKVTFTADNMGKGGFKLNNTTVTDKPLIATLENIKGDDPYEITDKDGVYSNNKTIDGVTFNFTGVNASLDSNTGKITPLTNPATLTGKTDVSDFKQNIIDFVNDYNTLLSSINSKLYETRDKSYTPLTDDQKSDMSDSEIEKWEKKAQTGLIRKDSDLENLARNMKDAMSTFMSSTGLSLEEIGIEPVQDYADKNGLLTIDEDKLTNALESNFDGVKDLFVKGIGDSDTTDGGVITKLKNVINSSAISSTANLVKKAGKDTGVSAITNEMSTQITEMKKKIAQMESDLTDRENALYSKYASLESSLSALQQQQSSLSSYLTN